MDSGIPLHPRERLLYLIPACLFTIQDLTLSAPSAPRYGTATRCQVSRVDPITMHRIQPYLDSNRTPLPDLLAQIIDRNWAMSREDFFRLCLAGDTETGLILLQMEIERRKTAGTWTEDEG